MWHFLLCTRIAPLPFWGCLQGDAYRGHLAPRTDFIEHARNIEQALDLLAKALRTPLGYTWTSFRHLARAPPTPAEWADLQLMTLSLEVLAAISLVSYLAFIMPWPPNESPGTLWHRQNVLWQRGPDYAYQATWSEGPVCSRAKPAPAGIFAQHSIAAQYAPEEVCQQFPRLLGCDHDQVTDLDVAFEMRAQFLRTPAV